MKSTAPAIWMLIFAIALSLQSSAFDPLPSGCVNHCPSSADCMVCISACEGYISNYADINEVRNSILSRQAVNTTWFDALAVYNLEKCWCSACCDYKYAGDSVHPCIYPCPCTFKNITNNATTTTLLDKNKRPELKTSFDEIKDSVNYNLCYLLNLLWIVIPGISALIIMWAGSRYMASEEDPAKRANARNILLYALGGLVLSLMACPAVDYLIVNTDITPLNSSCKCYEAMAIRPGVPPTLPFIANVTTQPFVQTTHGVPPTIVRNGTTTTKRTTTTSTTLGCLGPCEEYKKTKKLPAAFDWRNVNGKNYMTRVRDQGECGSCWAHGTLGSMEGVYNVEQCKPAENNLAEQDLVSCGYDGSIMLGCNGLRVFSNAQKIPFNWIKSNGICIETCFPYRAADVSCSGKCSAPKLWRITSVVVSGTSRDAVKAKLICTGPMAVVGWNSGHLITLAGWDDSRGCWIIKNSWGVVTGTVGPGGFYHDKGYAYIPYTSGGGQDITNSLEPPTAGIGVKAP